MNDKWYLKVGYGKPVIFNCIYTFKTRREARETRKYFIDYYSKQGKKYHYRIERIKK